MDRALNIDIHTWLTNIQGKVISQDILQDIRNKVGDISGKTNRELYNSVKEIIDSNGYIGVDANYVYQNMIGLHIAPMTLQNESFVLERFMYIHEQLGDAMNRIPYTYILWKIVNKYDLNIQIANNFSIDKTRVFDQILAETEL